MTISIHALRAEGDIVKRLIRGIHYHFYPRPPCGGRRFKSTTTSTGHLFLSTPSVRRATIKTAQLQHIRHNFYPRPPCGGRLSVWSSCGGVYDFYPRPPCGGRLIDAIAVIPDKNFYPRPPCGGRQQKFTKYCLLLRHKHENSSF